MCYVYAIGHRHDLENLNLSECYVGVTINPAKRWKGHRSSGYSVSKAITEFGWIFEQNMKILFEGPPADCFDIEELLRPLPHMGLNVAIGGHGGYTTYTQERNGKISKALAGITKSDDHRSKIKATKLKNEDSVGNKNSMASKWILTSPRGEEFKLHGNLYEFCKTHNLSAPTLRRELGKIIGPISTKFRDHGVPDSREIRINTTGWLLTKEI